MIDVKGCDRNKIKNISYLTKEYSGFAKSLYKSRWTNDAIQTLFESTSAGVTNNLPIW